MAFKEEDMVLMLTQGYLKQMSDGANAKIDLRLGSNEATCIAQRQIALD